MLDIILTTIKKEHDLSDLPFQKINNFGITCSSHYDNKDKRNSPD